jgi:hypothetical protein
MARSVLSHIKDVISVNYFNSKNGNSKDEEDEEIKNIRLRVKNTKSGFFLLRDNGKDDNKNKYINSVESEIVF